MATRQPTPAALRGLLELEAMVLTGQLAEGEREIQALKKLARARRERLEQVRALQEQLEGLAAEQAKLPEEERGAGGTR